MKTHPVSKYSAVIRHHRVALAGLLLTLLVLVIGAPAWASTLPDDVRQGTVPIPIPDSGGSQGGGSHNNDSHDKDNAGAGQAITVPVSAPSVTTTAADLLSESITSTTALTGVVSTQMLNLRAGPGTQWAVVGTAENGQVLLIGARNEENSWWYVCCATNSTTNGWVKASLVQPGFDPAEAATLLPVVAPAIGAADAPAQEVIATSPATPTRTVETSASDVSITDYAATVTADKLNLRAGPDTSSPILGKLLLNEDVTVTGRNQAGDWWYVCCLPASQTAGWASADFLLPAFPVDRVMSLPVFGASGHATQPGESAQSGGSANAQNGATTLALSASQSPEFAAAGRSLAVEYQIRNTGDITATAVELRNEVAHPLSIYGGLARTANIMRGEGTSDGHSLFSVGWPTVAPGESVTVTVMLLLAEDARPGAVLDNVASVAATNAVAASADVPIGLPPVGLPDFQ